MIENARRGGERVVGVEMAPEKEKDNERNEERGPRKKLWRTLTNDAWLMKQCDLIIGYYPRPVDPKFSCQRF
jgi:hypothetical protein